MGYYTRHKLEIIEGDTLTDHEQGIAELSGYENPFEDSIKWYDHQEHMRIYSKKFPTTVFKLIGEGEESGDMWHEYYLNGKMQLCKANITFDSFDKGNLA